MKYINVLLILCFSLVLIRCGNNENASNEKNQSGIWLTAPVIKELFEKNKVDKSPDFREEGDCDMTMSDLLKLYDIKDKQGFLKEEGYHFLGIRQDFKGGVKSSYFQTKKIKNHFILYEGCHIKINDELSRPRHSFDVMNLDKNILSFGFDYVIRNYKETRKIREGYISELLSMGFSEITEDFIGKYGDNTNWNMYIDSTQDTYFKDDTIVIVTSNLLTKFSIRIFDTSDFVQYPPNR